jgi:uncharacterized SAM-binding protein YcdF (DUF218 family)
MRMETGVFGMLAAAIRALVIPPLFLFLLYALGLLVARKKPWLGRALSIGSVSLLFLLGTHLGVILLVRPIEELEAPLANVRGTGAQAIVLLTSGRIIAAPEYGGADQPDMLAQGRIRYAAHLQRETALPVLVTGGFGPEDGFSESLAAGMARLLQQDYGIKPAWLEEKSRNTAENAIFSARLLKQAGISRILLVTDAMHMRRARLAFEHEGLQVVSAPTLFFGRGEFEPLGLLPSAEGWRRSYYAIYEIAGLAWYRLQYTLH